MPFRPIPAEAAARTPRRWSAARVGEASPRALVIEPVSWLLDGNSISDAVGRTDLTGALVAASRILHVLCVWIAVPLMFRPRANTYFNRRNAGPRHARHLQAGGPAPD